MSTTQLPRGRASKIRSAWEASFGVNPGSAFFEHNTYTHDFTRSRPLADDDILGAGWQNSYDSRPPGPGVEEASAQLSVPLDTGQIGWWLSAALGRVSASGSSPKVHTLSSGAGALPTLYIERELASGQFEAMAAAVVSGMTFSVGPGPGFHQVGVDLMGKKVVEYYASTAAGSPTVEPIASRVAKSIGTVKVGGSAIGQVISGQLKLTNDVTADRFVGDSEFASQMILESQAVDFTGTVRYSTDAIWRAQGIVASALLPTAVALSIEYIISANSKLILTVPEMSFEPINVPVGNGKSLTAQVKGRGQVGASAAMLAAVLTNAHATY